MATLSWTLHEHSHAHLGVVVSQVWSVVAEVDLRVGAFKLFQGMAHAVIDGLERMVWVGLDVEIQVRWSPGQARDARFCLLSNVCPQLRPPTCG